MTTPPPAVVLVGGEGTRLRPLTYRTPKQLLPVAGIPLIRRVLQPLESAGITEVVLSSGYRADAFDGIELGSFDVTFAVEDLPLGSGGGLAHAVKTAGITGTFVALNGDVIGDIDITALLDLHRDTGASASILVKKVDDPSEFGVAVLGSDGRVERFIEKPAPPAPSDLINAGVWVLETSILDPVSDGEPHSLEREVFPAVAASGKMRALRHDGWWHDVGRLDRYLSANLQCAATGPVPHGWRRDGSSLLAPGAAVDPTARVDASVLGPGARVGPEAKVSGSVLLEGAAIGAGAVVERSVIGPGSSVGDAVAVSDKIHDPSAGDF